MLAVRPGFRKLLRRYDLLGYYLESRLGVRTVFRRELPEPRFLIYAQGRSGSRLLCELLDSHPRIRCEMEILRSPVRDVRRFVHRSALASTCPAYGFKVKHAQLVKQGVDDVGGLLRGMHEDGWRIIHLVRRNVFRQAFSTISRRAREKAHTRPRPDGSIPPPPRVRVDLEWVIRDMRRRQRLLGQERQSLEGLDHHPLVYEDDLERPEDQERSVGAIVEWLGLEPVAAHTDMVRNTPRDLREVISNFDEVEAGLAGTEFEPWFREAVEF